MQVQSQTRIRLIMLVTIGAGFMSSLDLFVVNVAFDQIATDFGVGSSGGPTASDMSWVLNAYAVTFAALLVPFGRLADRYGRKSIFIGGLVLFVAASAACAFSGGVWALVLFRVLQAAGAAAMTPTSLSILMGSLPPEKRLGAIRLWSAIGAIAAALGPSVGGVLTQISWHWVFLINLPIGLVLLWFAVRYVQETKNDQDVTTPDLFGALLFALAVGLFALGLVQSPEWGWDSPATLGALAGSAVLALIFVWRSRRHISPVIDTSLFKVRAFGWANISMLIFNFAFSANLLIGILWMQQVWGWSALLTGLAIAVGPAMVPITVVLTNRFLPNVSPPRLVTVGALLFALGTLVIVMSIGNEPNYWLGYFPGWVIGGVGVGFALPNLMGGATQGLPPTQTATGSAIVSMTRQIGFVIGISTLFAIVGDQHGLAATDSYLLTWSVAAAALVVTAAAAFGMASRTKTPALV